MHILNRAGLIAAAAALLPTAPAVAAEITPTGQLFSDYTVNFGDVLGGATPLRNTFNITRAFLGLNVKLNDDIWAKLQTDVSATATSRLDVTLRHGFVDMSFFGLGRVRGGQIDTLWIIPVEEEWLPFRYAGQAFTLREGLFPIWDRGLIWYGPSAPVEVALGVFNGEGEHSRETVSLPASFTKAYEARVRVKPLENAEIAFDARVADAPPNNPRATTLTGGLNVRLGPAVMGAEGVYNMVTDNKGLQTNGMGGSAHLFLPKMAMNHTPLLRADYYDADPSNATSNAHLRLIAGLGYEWAKGLDTMLTYEYLVMAKTTAIAPEQVLAVKGGLKF